MDVDCGENVERIRSLNRENVEKERKINREVSVNNRRRELAAFEKRTYQEQDVVLLTNNLLLTSSKSISDASTLTALKNAIIENGDNIDAFFKVPGSLHALIGQFTGTDTTRQLLAAECLCNIALGPFKTCLIVSKAAGAYLITYLDSANTKLVEVCAWTLGNLVAESGTKIATILKAQGFLDKIIPLLNVNNEKEIIFSAEYAISHFVVSNYDLLEYYQLEEIINFIADHEVMSKYAVKFLFVASIDDDLIDLFSILKIFSKLLIQLVATVNKPKWENEKETVDCLIKVSANLSCNKVVLNSEIAELLDENFKNCIQALLTTPLKELRAETLWLLGNIWNYVGSDSPLSGVLHSYLKCIQVYYLEHCEPDYL